MMSFTTTAYSSANSIVGDLEREARLSNATAEDKDRAYCQATREFQEKFRKLLPEIVDNFRLAVGEYV